MTRTGVLICTEHWNMLRAPFLVKDLSHSREALNVIWKDGANSVFPSTWLRSSLREPEFFSASSSMYTDSHLDLMAKDVPIKETSLTDQPDGGPGNGVSISWEDQCSVFDASWLRAQDTANWSGLRDERLNPVQWDNTVQMPEYDFANKDSQFESWMIDLRRYGILVVRGVPTTEQGMRDFMQKIGPLKQRYHPTDIFTLMTEPEKIAVDMHAYGPKPLSAHTDTTYHLMPAKFIALLGVEYSAPISDTVTFYGDGSKVVEDLRREDPESFEILSTTKYRLSRRRVGVEEPCDPASIPMYHWDTYVDITPIIMDGDKMKRLQFFMGKIGAYDLHGYDDKHMKRFINACEKLQRRMDNRKYHYDIIIKPGTLVIADNHRCYHGRLEIEPSSKRKVYGCYTVDEIWKSRWRLMHGMQSGLPSRWLYGCSDESLEVLSRRMEC